MNRYKLIYFKGCPNYSPAVEILEDIGIEFETICQDNLSDSDLYSKYSSPTLLRDDVIIFGAEVSERSCSFKLPSKEELSNLLRN